MTALVFLSLVFSAAAAAIAAARWIVRTRRPDGDDTAAWCETCRALDAIHRQEA